MTNKLMTCPFCGREAERKANRRYRKGFIAGVGCVSQRCPAKIEQATMSGTPEQAYKHAENVWNDRTTIARHIDDWHEDYGDALWWTFPIEESPYCGSPLDTDWPGYHTHWTPLILPQATVATESTQAKPEAVSGLGEDNHERD